LSQLPGDTLFSASEEVYGITMGIINEQTYVYLIGKDGLIEQWHITMANGIATGEVVRTMQVPSQPEGGVVWDEKGWLLVGEEDKGVWQFDATPEGPTAGTLVVDVDSNAHLAADIEGIGLYLSDSADYLVVSSQGNHSYAIFTLPDYIYQGSFRIVSGEDVDGAEETDGLEVTSAALSPQYPQGLLVVQDGFNDGTQNFKLVDWAAIARLFKPVLAIDPQ
jgi:3-phytase